MTSIVTHRVAILHDFMLVNGGAERLVDMLATELSAPLIVGFTNSQAGPFKSGKDHRLKALGIYLHGRLARYLINIWRFSYIDSNILNRDAVVYSGVISPLAVFRQNIGRKIYYCHSPPRFLYDLKQYYWEKSNPLVRLSLIMLRLWYQPRYVHAVQSMDLVVANSRNVQARLHRYLGVNSVVVYPPVDIERYRWIESGDFYLSTARLEDLKRVDLVVEAFRCMPEHKLVVLSGGALEKSLRALAANCPNIIFTSWLEDASLADWVGRCRAVIYVPIDEDFGISPVEAMSAGKPVIGVADGGMLETVIDGKTGILLKPNLSPEDLIQAVRAMTPSRSLDMRSACELQAKYFSEKIFVETMRKILID